MRILVFDDNEANREAARIQLQDHDLTIVGTYDEAQKALAPRIDQQKFKIAIQNTDGTDDLNYSMIDKLRIDATIRPHHAFDVVLTDLLVPASSQHQGSMELIGQQMPVGIFIGLLAAVGANVPYVAVFTDSDHHDHPASACFDSFNSVCGANKPVAFKIESSKVLLVNYCGWFKYDKNEVRVKNWAALLDYLVE